MTVPTLKFDALLLPGIDQAAGHARRWLHEVLGEHPSFDDAALCASELVTNALRYADSGRDGQIRVEVSHSECMVRVEVIDEGGGASVPHVASADEMDVCGRGLQIVACLATTWGIARRNEGHAAGRFQSRWLMVGRDVM